MPFFYIRFPIFFKCLFSSSLFCSNKSPREKMAEDVIILVFCISSNILILLSRWNDRLAMEFYLNRIFSVSLSSRFQCSLWEVCCHPQSWPLVCPGPTGLPYGSDQDFLLILSALKFPDVTSFTDYARFSEALLFLRFINFSSRNVSSIIYLRIFSQPFSFFSFIYQVFNILHWCLNLPIFFFVYIVRRFYWLYFPVLLLDLFFWPSHFFF